MTTLEFILSLVTALLSGGLATLATVKYKRKQEQTNTAKGDVELTTQLANEYQQTTLSLMNRIEDLMKQVEEERKKNQEKESRQLTARIDELTSIVTDVRVDVNDIMGCLNGSFKSYREHKRNEKGQFCKADDK